MTTPAEQLTAAVLERTAATAAEQHAAEVEAMRTRLGVDLPRPAPAPVWSRQYLVNLDHETPEYGTPEWEALPDSDPRKVAAVVRAAEQYRRETDPATIARRLADELHALRQLDAEAEAAGYAQAAAQLTPHDVAPRPEPFAPAVPIRQSAGWPPVRIGAPPSARGRQVTARPTSPLGMLRQLGRHGAA